MRLAIIIIVTIFIVIIIFLLYKYFKNSESFTDSDPHSNSKKFCIFDLDNTLTHGTDANDAQCPNTIFYNDNPPAWPDKSGTTNNVKEIIKRCKDNGYELAIATAEYKDQYDKNFNFIKNLDPIFDDDFLKSDRFQQVCSVIKSPYCTSNAFRDKTAMYINIMNSEQIPPNEWKNSVVFDDDIKNLYTANMLGFKTCQASPECGGRNCTIGCGIPSSCFHVFDS